MTRPPAEVGVRYRRWPFLAVSWEGQGLVLTNCDSLRRFRVDDRLLGLLSRLGQWQSTADLDAGGASVSSDSLEQLHQMGVVERAGPDEPDDDTELACWSPFELAVHRSQNTGGERNRAHLVGPPPAAFKPRPAGAATPLPPARPLSGRLDRLLEARRSIRAFGSGALALDDLAALLHHSDRVIKVIDDAHVGQQVFRPYAGGGARSELELYVVANDVEGLVTGAHWYDGRAHDLVYVRGPDTGQDRINVAVDEATGGLSRRPQVVLLITAVFARIMWKYQGIGLGLIDRDVGCLYQTLYLVATALGLAPCAVGAGPEAANATWLGLDPLVESQVGCFMIGTRESEGD